ncbi:MAG: ATP-binding protein [Candidatus Gracilibacteria bacterium]
MNTIINRQQYISQIESFVEKPIIKVILGQRRVGKSYILLLIIDYLKNKGIDEKEIIYINKEDLKWDNVRDYSDLYEATKNYKYVFIDEIQEILEWEKCIRSLALDKKDIYISGSNSDLLSGELATVLSGRYVSFEIFPLNYEEFLNFHGVDNSEDSFFKYIKYGGLPYLVNMNLSDEVYKYLKDINNTIVLKDIVTRYKIKNINFYEKLLEFLSKNVGSIFSANSISNFLKNQKISLNTNIILEYLNHTKTAFLINEVPRYDIKGKKIFEVRNKYYYTDIGIRNAILNGYNITDISGILENVVFMNLKSKGWSIMVGEIGDYEIDFVCEKDSKKMYIQVAYLLESEDTIKREFGNLTKIGDNWPKYVLSMDKYTGGGYEGIESRNIREFLLEI